MQDACPLQADDRKNSREPKLRATINLPENIILFSDAFKKSSIRATHSPTVPTEFTV